MFWPQATLRLLDTCRSPQNLSASVTGTLPLVTPAAAGRGRATAPGAGREERLCGWQLVLLGRAALPSEDSNHSNTPS